MLHEPRQRRSWLIFDVRQKKTDTHALAGDDSAKGPKNRWHSRVSRASFTLKKSKV
jgi:hypothetical protein